jgi:hypothetical protein
VSDETDVRRGVLGIVTSGTIMRDTAAPGWPQALLSCLVCAPNLRRRAS